MAKVLILCTCAAEMRLYGDFYWPRSGRVVAPDWKSGSEHGRGHCLHGFLWGEGAGGSACWFTDAVWLVVETDSEVVEAYGSMCRFPHADVKFAGNRYDATQYLHANGGRGRQIIGLTLAGGDRCAFVGGSGSRFTGGYGCTFTGTNGCTFTGSYGCTFIGETGCLFYGGEDCSFTGGDRCAFHVTEWDEASRRQRTHVGYVGEAGIAPGKPYTRSNGVWVPASNVERESSL